MLTASGGVRSLIKWMGQHPTCLIHLSATIRYEMQEHELFCDDVWHIYSLQRREWATIILKKLRLYDSFTEVWWEGIDFNGFIPI